ncbi:MAG: isocitrate/isopropylmalate dehydrogenase family protein [Candidatus Bathyarchaeota archaeon]
MSKKYNIVVLRGDGISKEVIPEAVKALKAAQDSVKGLQMNFTEYECGFEYYQKTGEPWPTDAYPACKESDAILFGAVGMPGVAGLEHIVYVHRLLRQKLDLYANVRPVKLRTNIQCPLAGKKILERADKNEVGIDIKIVTRRGSERIIKFAFDLCKAKNRGAPSDGKKRVTCVDKSTVLKSCALFREIFDEVAENYPSIEKDYALIDAWAQWAIRRPEYYDVVVTTNMFGDIISDLTSTFQGGLGVAPSAEIGDRYGMFRPIHGSAPKYYGKNVANPIATILSAKMLLDWLAQMHNDESAQIAASKIDNAVDLTLEEGKVLPRDLGGEAKTSEVGNEIVRKVHNS